MTNAACRSRPTAPRPLCCSTAPSLGRCFKGYLLLSAANPAFAPEIAAALAAAEAGPAPGSERERLHLAVFAAWSKGALDRTFAIWRKILAAHSTAPSRPAGATSSRK